MDLFKKLKEDIQSSIEEKVNVLTLGSVGVDLTVLCTSGK